MLIVHVYLFLLFFPFNLYHGIKKIVKKHKVSRKNIVKL
jgi:hypothetical protein